MDKIRPASPDDTEQIVNVLIECFDAEKLPYTILGCSGVATFVHDTIRAQEYRNQNTLFVCEDNHQIMAVAEIRRFVSSIFLNHIYVQAAYRGLSIGSHLFREGIIYSRDHRQVSCALDVFWDNPQARHWYDMLGLLASHTQVWLEVSLGQPAPVAATWWTTSNLAQANQIHAVYDFSQFEINTEAGSYSVGRLGGRLFRVVDVEILSDPAALSALHDIDPDRKLLLIGPEDDILPRLTASQTVIAKSERRIGSIDTILARLGRKAQ